MPTPHPRDKPCRRCLAPLVKVDDRHCPTCGLSVWFSLNPNDSLDTANPAWTRSIIIGACLLAAALAFGIAASVAFKSQSFFDARFSPAIICRIVQLLVSSAGLFMLATPEHRYPDLHRLRRAALRILAGVMLINALGIAIFPAHVSPTAHFSEELTDEEAVPPAIVLSFLLISQAVLWIGSIMTWLCVRSIARRARATPLARFISWLLLFTFLRPVLFYIFVPGVSLAFESSFFLGWLFLVTDAVEIGVLLWAVRVVASSRAEAMHVWVKETKPSTEPIP
jgi:hypothetical protein